MRVARLPIIVDTSTNDSFVVLANGASLGALIDSVDSPEYRKFEDELREVSEHLSQLIVRDGEGATKFIRVNVKVP